MARKPAISIVGGALLGVALSTHAAVAQGPITGNVIRAVPVEPKRFVARPLDEGPGAFSPLRGVKGATIFGIVQNHLGHLVPNAGIVHLRSLADGEIVSSTPVDSLAQFSFKGFEPGQYIAELVGESGGLLATSAQFTAGFGEIIQLAPVVPVSPATGLAGLFQNAGTSAVSSAAGAGITAISPGQPVSDR